MSWKRYGFAVLLFNTLGFIACYALMRTQALLPLNPQGLAGVGPEVSFNTAVSFATNTNWQGYGGETTMSYLTQMLALTVQNFVSAATGMAILAALIRGLSASNLPVTVVLDDSMGMTPAMKLSMFPKVVVGARISASGNAMPQAGDMQVLTEGIDVNRKEPLTLVINSVVP